MNSPEQFKIHSDAILQLESIADGIMKTIETEITSSYDIFTDLLSTMQYQSIPELVDTLILRTVEKEWTSLTHDEPSLLTESRVLRGQIHADLRNMIVRSVRFPTFLQKIIRLQVQTVMLTALPPHEQDRIIAKEMQIRYADWQALLGLFSLYRDISGPLLEARTMHIKYVNHEQKDMLLQVYAPIEIEEDIPGIYATQQYILTMQQYQNNAILVPTPVSIIYIEHTTLERMHDILGGDDIKSAVRNQFHYIPAYKKRSFGDKTPPKEKEAGKLAWEM